MYKKLEAYLDKLDSETRSRMLHIRDICIRTFPEASEDFKYGLPAFSLKQVLIVYGAHPHHIGFYPTPPVIEQFAEDIKDYKSAKGSVQFPHDQPFPTKLIDKMVHARYKNYLEKFGTQ